MTEKRTLSKTITLQAEPGAFTAIFSRFKTKKEGENPDLSMLRSMLSHEKARLLHLLKTKQPNSIYELAKLLGRDFKSVRQDIRVLEEFGFVEMIPIYNGKRQKLKPILVINQLKINIEI
jgi:predicted transcriptional regulator